MVKLPVIFDLETKHTFREEPDHRKLGISVAAVYNYRYNKAEVFTEQQLPELFRVLENASWIIGYNVKSFDMRVLQGYYPGDTTHFPVFDILDDIKGKIGHRIALNDVISATLNKHKTGHGLMAIDYYREGKMDKLKQYCMDDVTLTGALFDYGVRNKEIYYLDERGKVTIKVDWAQYLETSSEKDIALTLPF